jgi:hypothetical protein
MPRAEALLGHAQPAQGDQAEGAEERDEGRSGLGLAQLPERRLDRADVDEGQEHGDQAEEA